MDERRQEQILARIALAQRRRLKGVTPRKMESVPATPRNSNSLRRPVVRNSNKLADVRRKPKAYAPSRGYSIFLSGGIGDVMAIESFMTDQEREHLTTIYYGTNKRAPLTMLFRALPNYPNLKDHVTIWDDFTQFWCFFSKEECIHRLLASQQPDAAKQLHDSLDYSIMSKFHEIRSGKRSYNGSSFVKHPLASVSYAIPKPYVVICPYSTDKRIRDRDFSNSDWQACLDYLQCSGRKGIILNSGNDFVPGDDKLVDLSNQPNILESIEILKGASGYIGVDSCLSVLAAKIFDYPNILVKSVNSHCYENQATYYAPQTDFKFLVRAIMNPLKP